ncbi:hypothetical protein BHE74_00053501 [Ensete ventricosum]|nr:hypothetical protein BHE74_00053501 [Ensete ventricosum]
MEKRPPMFEISSCTVHYGRYIPVRQFTVTWTARYGRYRQKSAIGSRLREKSTIGGRLKEIGDRRKREEEEEEKKKRRRNRTSTVATLRSPAPSRRPRVARALSHPTLAGDFSPARGDGTSPRTGRKIEATSPLF